MSLHISSAGQRPKRLLIWLCACAFGLLITAGIFAKNGWFPSTDPLSGKRKGWFGRPVSESPAVAGGLRNSTSNPFAAPPTPTPLPLSKEYIYAGSRLLAVEDANANAAPPTDLAVWRPSTGTWYVLGGPGSNQTTQVWGQPGDVPVPGDFDGDGKTDFAIMRPDTTANQWWIIYSSNSSMVNFGFGVSGDVPAQADFDGDGRTDAAVYKASTGVWYIQGSTAGYYIVTWGGQSGDTPAPADYDGDGRADVAVYRNSNTSFYTVASSNSAMNTYSVEHAGTAVPGDYDGDGRADAAVFETSTGYWRVRKSTTGTVWTSAAWGVSTDITVQNDYDADGKVDLAVWRPGDPATWYIINSHDGSYRIQNWGQTGDIPVPAFYRR